MKIIFLIKFLVISYTLHSTLLSLVSALCNMSEKVGSQCYIHIYFKIQGNITLLNRN